MANFLLITQWLALYEIFANDYLSDLTTDSSEYSWHVLYCSSVYNAARHSFLLPRFLICLFPVVSFAHFFFKILLFLFLCISRCCLCVRYTALFLLVLPIVLQKLARVFFTNVNFGARISVL